jgi:hypothetical protein
MIGGAAGVLLASWATKSFVALAGDTLPAAPIGLDARVVVFALAVATLAALLSGCCRRCTRRAPRWRLAARRRPPGRPAGSRRTRNVLVGAEVALALDAADRRRPAAADAVGHAARRARLQRRPHRHGDRQPAGHRYRTPGWSRVLRPVHRAVRAVPGVESARSRAASCCRCSRNSDDLRVRGQAAAAAGTAARVPVENVSPGFFETIGARLAAGRAFQDGDHDRGRSRRRRQRNARAEDLARRGSDRQAAQAR